MFVNFQRIAEKNSISLYKRIFNIPLSFFFFSLFLPECQFPKESSRGFEEHWRATRHISLYRYIPLGRNRNRWRRNEEQSRTRFEDLEKLDRS